MSYAILKKRVTEDTDLMPLRGTTWAESRPPISWRLWGANRRTRMARIRPVGAWNGANGWVLDWAGGGTGGRVRQAFWSLEHPPSRPLALGASPPAAAPALAWEPLICVARSAFAFSFAPFAFDLVSKTSWTHGSKGRSSDAGLSLQKSAEDADNL